MPGDPHKSADQKNVWLLLSVCVGATSLLYLYQRRARKRRVPSGLEPETLSASRKPKPGDILLFRNARGLNKLITWFTGSPYYHVGLYAGNGHTVEARTPGVVRQDLRGREHDFDVVPAPEGRGRAALVWAETQVGAGYDREDIAIIILDRLCRFIHFNYTPNDKYACGEFVAEAFDKAGAPLFPEKDLGAVVPGDFARFLPPAERRRAG